MRKTNENNEKQSQKNCGKNSNGSKNCGKNSTKNCK